MRKIAASTDVLLTTGTATVDAATRAAPTGRSARLPPEVSRSPPDCPSPGAGRRTSRCGQRPASACTRLWRHGSRTSPGGECSGPLHEDDRFRPRPARLAGGRPRAVTGFKQAPSRFQGRAAILTDGRRPLSAAGARRTATAPATRRWSSRCRETTKEAPVPDALAPFRWLAAPPGTSYNPLGDVFCVAFFHGLEPAEVAARFDSAETPARSITRAPSFSRAVASCS